MKSLRPRLAAPARKGWQHDDVRGNRHERGYGRDWDALRKQALERDAGLCQPCLKQDLVHIGNQVDHIVPKACGGGDNLDNLQTICDDCHRAKTARESTGGWFKTSEAS